MRPKQYLRAFPSRVGIVAMSGQPNVDCRTFKQPFTKRTGAGNIARSRHVIDLAFLDMQKGRDFFGRQILFGQFVGMCPAAIHKQ